MHTHLHVVPVAAAISLGLSIQPGQAQQAGADWPMFNRDLAATRYSPLTQINTKNVAKLTRAWSYKLNRHPSSGSITGGSEFSPIVVAGAMYLTNINAVIALDPETGRELWRYELANGHALSKKLKKVTVAEIPSN